MAQLMQQPAQHSPGGSPADSLHQKGEISTGMLINYLVASKRSLESINLVQRATTILAEARLTVESTTSLNARTIYLRRALTTQLKMLRGLQFELEGSLHAVETEFQAVLQQLDLSDKKLSNILETLQTTRIEEAFRRVTGSDDASATSTKDTLLEFVDDQPVQVLRHRIKISIDAVDDARVDASQSIGMLEDQLQTVNELLDERNIGSASASDIQQPNVTKVLRLLDGHAKEMAEDLESLVKHFDLCVTAIKHTEGGGIAIAKNVQTEEFPEGLGVEGFDVPPEPMSNEEQREMLQVLENDAGEIDDVVIEIQDRHVDMEAFLEQLLGWSNQMTSSYNNVEIAFKLLQDTGSRLSNHVADSSAYSTRWQEEKASLKDCIAGMDDLCDMYDNFLIAYDSLIIETARRRTVKKQMERVVQEANTRLEQLYVEDLEERNAFRTEKGDHLPSDIWSGIGSLPPKHKFSIESDETGSIPELSKKVVEGALRRLKANPA